jgi:hypothetical protein
MMAQAASQPKSKVHAPKEYPMKRLLLASALLISVAVQAKLPVPVMDDAAKAKAAESKAKADHGNKVGAYKLCQWQDKAASTYFKTASAAGKAVKPAVAMPPCADPGPFVPPMAGPVPGAAAPKA